VQKTNRSDNSKYTNFSC